jgi:hypothetical protein
MLVLMQARGLVDPPRCSNYPSGKYLIAWFKLARLFRGLRPKEAALARDVSRNTLPPLNTIGIANGDYDDKI